MRWLERLFVPHEGNDFRPHALQKAAVVGMGLLILITFTIANFQSIIWIGSSWLVSTVLPAVVTDETNAARAAASLPPLSRNSVLDEAAQLKADDMAKNGYFAHWSPDGVSPWHWFEVAGYRYAHAGENLAVHFTDSTAVVEAWLDSPSHRANIMNGNYSEIGIGTAKGEFEGYDTVFVVQLFGTPAAAGEPETVTVTSPAEPAEATESVSLTADDTVVYESYTATSVPGAVLAAEGSVVKTPPASLFGRIATSPRLVLQIVYSIISIFVIGALMVALSIEWRRHHPIQIAYSAGLLAVMIALFAVHSIVSGGAIIA